MKVKSGTQSPVWSKEVVDILVKEVQQGRDISVGDYTGSAADVELALRIQVQLWHERTILWAMHSITSYLYHTVHILSPAVCPLSLSRIAHVKPLLIVQGVQGKSVMVGGSISPWVESIALALGCKKIITSDYGSVAL
jgi:hypothetical protein